MHDTNLLTKLLTCGHNLGDIIAENGLHVGRITRVDNVEPQTV